MDMHAMHEHTMTGTLGPYPMTREASGTAWQPDAATHRGVHAYAGAWSLMLHGMVTSAPSYARCGSARPR